jgi:prepilin-type N-terminal cleavage/methylation domain-containing protein
MIRARQESGFTLIELLVVSTLMLVVLGATLTTFESFQKNANVNERQNDAQQEARRSIDYLARELRNLASPIEGDPKSVKRAEGADLIVQSVAPTRDAGSLNQRNTQYVRFCYNATTARVIRQRLTWTTAVAPAYPTGTACPSSGWESTDFAANVVNASRPLFTYTWDGSDLTTITEVHTSLWVDVNPGASPAETTLSTTVFLRNQNREPIASFSAAPTVDGKILLNGSESSDPEERSLRYYWYDEDVSTTVPRGEGIVYEYAPPAFGDRHVFLKVLDPASLEGQAETETVCVPGGGISC